MTNDSKSTTVLVVDDVPENLRVVTALLKDEYKIRIATNGLQALEMANKDPLPSLILLDVMMPEMDGYEVCKRLKENPETAEIPVIFLTAMTEVRDETKGFSLGAVDFITKPISPAILSARVRTHLVLKQARDVLQNHNNYLEREVAKRTKQVQRIQDVTIIAMASLAEARDNETGNHILRTQRYIRILAEHLSQQPDYAEALQPETIDLLYKSAPLHDIGKVGIPDHILLKPGKLSNEEFEIMKTHTTLGLEAIKRAEAHLDGEDLGFLKIACEIALSHQEKWDGSGYPQGLSGEDIPLSARLMAVADVYDALISARVYKPAFSHEKAAQIIKEGTGQHFDPAIVDAFIVVEPQFKTIAAAYSDTPEG